MIKFLKEMAVDVFSVIVKLIKWIIVIEIIAITAYYTVAKFYDKELIESNAKRIGHKITSFLKVKTEEKERLFKAHSSCVLEHAALYYMIGSIIGTAIGYLSCRCWKGFKEGMILGAIRNDALDIYVGAIQCDEGKKA